MFRHLGKFKEFNSFEVGASHHSQHGHHPLPEKLKHRYHDDVTETLATPLDLAASKKADFTMSEIQTAMAALPSGLSNGGAIVSRRWVFP